MKVLIIKLGAIGDVIRTTSILPGLKEKHSCSIEWITKKESFDILKNNNLIENIYLINNNIKDKLKSKKYDLVISLDDEDEACEMASYVKPTKIIGAFLKNNERTYTEDSSLWFDMGIISKFGKKKADEIKAKNRKTYQEIMYKILGLDYTRQEPILSLSKKELDFGRKFAEKNKIKKNYIIIGINTGAGGRWKDKKLSEDETAELIDKLNNQTKAKILLFGGPEEIERNKKIKRLVKADIIDAGCNNSLMQFASLINLCDLLVTSDSLALHIGTALKKKIVAFFCPTSPHEIELYSRGIKIIPKKGCICCYKPKCDIPPEWNIDEIADAVKRLLMTLEN